MLDKIHHYLDNDSKNQCNAIYIPENQEYTCAYAKYGMGENPVKTFMGKITGKFPSGSNLCGNQVC